MDIDFHFPWRYIYNSKYYVYVELLGHRSYTLNHYTFQLVFIIIIKLSAIIK